MRNIISNVCILVILSSCNLLSSKSKDKISEEEVLEQELMQESTEKMKRIFFVLPSPIEISLLINKAGVHFREDLLNKTEKLAGYSSSPSRSIALGVYCADLSYAGLYEQYQVSVEYINVARNLAESLGVLHTVEQEKIETLEQNVTNKELIVDIISEIYMESNEQLREQDRYALAALVLTAGWIESMYLATQSVSLTKESHQVLIKQIVDQKLSLESIKSVLRDNQSNPVIPPIYSNILELEELFERCVSSVDLKEDADYIETIDTLFFVQLVAKISDMRAYLVD